MQTTVYSSPTFEIHAVRAEAGFAVTGGGNEQMPEGTEQNPW